MDKDIRLPLIELIINKEDETGITANSFVDNPATEIGWYAFSKAEKKFSFKSDDVKQMITAPLMLADTPIYRKQGDKEFNVFFSADSLRNAMVKFMAEGKDTVNLHHSSFDITDKVNLVEMFQLDDRFSQSVFDGVPKGSLIATYHIPDLELYNELVKSKDFNGFSIEVITDERLISEEAELPTEDELLEEIFNVMNSDISDDDKVAEIELIAFKKCTKRK